MKTPDVEEQSLLQFLMGIIQMNVQSIRKTYFGYIQYEWVYF